MKRGIWWACCLVCGSAFAEQGVHWQYIAPPECPSEQQFRELVRARLLGNPRASEAAQSEGGDGSVDVEVRLEPSQHRATLVLKEPNHAPVERLVDGDSCEELVSGVALIAALAFGAAREPPNATDTAAAPQAAEPEAAVKTSEPAPLSGAQPPPVKPAPATHDERFSSPAPLAAEVGAGGWVNTWTAPNGGLGVDLFLRMAPRAPRTWSMRVALLYGLRASYVGDRLAEFRFLGGRAEGCPISQSVQRRLSGEGCLALEMGALRGRGRDSSALLEGASDTVFSATAIVTGRIRARLGERIFVEGQGDLALPLLRHEFVFEEPPERIFRTPVLGFSARLGLGVQFP